MQTIPTIETRLGVQMEGLVNECGITAVTHALINEIEGRENWRQTENLRGIFSEYLEQSK